MDRTNPFNGKRMRERRLALRMTQAALAERTGLPQADISKYETGRTHPVANRVTKIARALGASMDWLYGEGPDDLYEAGLADTSGKSSQPGIGDGDSNNYSARARRAEDELSVPQMVAVLRDLGVEIPPSADPAAAPSERLIRDVYRDAVEEFREFRRSQRGRNGRLRSDGGGSAG